MKAKYKHFLKLDNGEQVEVRPLYKDDLSLEYKMENNERFYRSQLSGKLTFVRNDFSLIFEAPFNTTFYYEVKILIEKSPGNAQYETYYLGKFNITDCEVDIDNKRIEVQPQIDDSYTKVIAGLEKKYDLLKLPVGVNPIRMDKRSVIQVYVPGDSTIACFLGGTYWEQDCEVISDGNSLINTYHFYETEHIGIMEVEELEGAIPGIGGIYIGNIETQDDGNVFSAAAHLYNDSNREYKIDISYIDDRFSGAQYAIWTLVREIDTVQLYSFVTASPGPFENHNLVTYTMNALNDATGTIKATLRRQRIYARMLLGLSSFKGQSTFLLGDNDLTGNSRGYNYVIGYAEEIISVSSRFSDKPTEWGKKSEGAYYLPPRANIQVPFYPISRTNWSSVSYWYYPSVFDEILEKQSRKSFVLRDAYSLASTIDVLLKQIAPEISHEATPEYSQFLYSADNPLGYPNFKLHIAPKSNVLVGEYQEPAQKGEMTLKIFLDFFRNAMQCYWYIEDNKLKIEHISWFKNGGSYSGISQVGIDLTRLINPRNDKPWSYGINKYNYSKPEMPERYQFTWADGVSEAFGGYPIEILSPYVQEGNIEEINISQLNSDVDIMLLNPNNMSPDGFAIMGAVNAQIANEVYDSFTNTLVIESGRTKSIPINANGQKATIKYRVNKEIAYSFKVNGLVGTYNKFLKEDKEEAVLSIPDNATDIIFYNYKGENNVAMYLYGIYAENILELPYYDTQIDSVKYRLQNGYLSMIAMHQNYWMHNLPAKLVKINKKEQNAKGIKRLKKQTVSCPIENNNFDTNRLIKTDSGNGEIEKISINLSSRMAKINLAYDTE